jgi:hypothetical protein
LNWLSSYPIIKEDGGIMEQYAGDIGIVVAISLIILYMLWDDVFSDQ